MTSTPQAAPVPSTRSKRRKTTVVAKVVKKKPKFSLDYNWRKAILRHRAYMDDGLHELQETQNETVLDYFSSFFTPDIIADIVFNTNLYSVQENGRSIQLIEEELESFLAVQILMGVVQMPA